MKSIEIEIPIDKNDSWDVSQQVSVVDRFTLINELRKSITTQEKKLDELTVTIESTSKLKEFPLLKLFSIEKGKGIYTKKYGNLNNGDYPVYSASNTAPLTSIKSFDYNGKFLTWATNGFAGYIKIIDGKFSINADRGLLKPLNSNLNIRYIKYILEPILRDLAKGRKGEKGEDEFTKVYPSMLKKIKINIPVNKSGNLDVELQNIIALQYQKVEDIKSLVKNELEKIQQIDIEYE